MTLTTLTPTPGLLARAAVEDARAALVAARDAVERLTTLSVPATFDGSMPAAEVEALDEDLAAIITGLGQVESQASALRLTAVAEADRRRTATRAAATGTDAWAAALTGERREVLAGGLRLAGLLAGKYHHTRAAYAAGHLRLEQVKIIVNTAEQAPPETTPDQLATAEDYLVSRATGLGHGPGGTDAAPMTPRRLRHAARHMLRIIDTDLAAHHEAIVLGREHRTARTQTHLMLADNGDGTYTGRFTIPELHGHLLRHALDRLTSPRRENKTTTPDESAPNGHGYGLNHAEVQGLALCELLEHLPTTGHAAPGTTIAIHLDHQALLADLDGRATGTARLSSGTEITAAEARRLACEAKLIPLVLGSDSQPLDLGRTRRLHTPGQRLALSQHHTTCAITGCERPFAWCEIHHPHPWSHGGPTDLTNALPLCAWHHHRAHEPDWTLTPPPDPDGDWTLQPRRRRRPRRGPTLTHTHVETAPDSRNPTSGRTTSSVDDDAEHDEKSDRERLEHDQRPDPRERPRLQDGGG